MCVEAEGESESLTATRQHVAFQLRTSYISAGTVLLRLQRSIVNPVIELRAAHTEDLCCFGNFEA